VNGIRTADFDVHPSAAALFQGGELLQPRKRIIVRRKANIEPIVALATALRSRFKQRVPRGFPPIEVGFV
jgi:hypothetical protein